MSKSEMSKMDTIIIGPLLLFFNQYFDLYFNQYTVLCLAFVSQYSSILSLSFLGMKFNFFFIFFLLVIHHIGFFIFLLFNLSAAGNLFKYLHIDH